MSNNNTWDLLLIRAKEVGKAVGDVASDVVESSRQKLDELKVKNELEDAYVKMGKLCYNSMNDGETDEAAMRTAADEISTLEVRLAKLREAKKKDPEEASVSCPHCNAANRKGSTYCSYCGKSMKAE